MDPTEQFRDLVREPDEAVPLARAALLIAAHDHPVDVDTALDALDALAAAAPDHAEGIARYLFVEQGFAGNERDYGDPSNSFLDEVLRRRLGIPITLSVLMLEVGRRRGLALVGIGMPGHFLVGNGRGEFYDPFHGGVPLDEVGCRLLFEATRGATPFLPEYLRPVGSRATLARMLANLVQTYSGRHPAAAAWAVRLRLLIPDLSVGEQRDGAAMLGRLGRFAEAATALEALAGRLPDEAAARVVQDATALRARAN